MIIHIDADAFFASVEQGFNPLLRGKPVIVGGTASQRGVVHTASYEARRYGIGIGMSLVEAKRKCPQAIFLKGNFQHYQAASLTMQHIYLKYTPAVEFTSLDDAYLDLHGAMHLYRSPEILAKAIQKDVKDALGIGVSLGIGKNKLVARIASGTDKPNGITCIPPGEESRFLQSLPVAQIPGIGRVAQSRLAELGISTIGEMTALSKLMLARLFGSNGVKMWEFARGVDRRTVAVRILPTQISRETTFEEDLTDQSIVLATLQYLSERIAGKLRQDAQTCRRVAVKIRYSDFTSHKQTQLLHQAGANAIDIFSAVEAMVAQIPFKRLRIRHVGVKVSDIRWDNAQLALFDEETRLEVLDTAVDEIRQRFGFTAILPADTLVLHKKYRMEKNGFVLHSPALTR